MNGFAKVATTFLIFIASTSLSFNVVASNLEDVIYQTDGSILRGELIEQDFAAGTFKIRLMGGSIFSVKREDIIKITREASLQHTSASTKTPSVNVEVTQSGITNHNESPVATEPDANVVALNSTNGHYPAPQFTNKNDSIPPHVLILGRASRYYQYSDEFSELEVTYRGATLGYQANLSEHFSLYFDYSRGQFDDDKFEDDNGPFSAASPELEDSHFSSIQALALLSTGNKRNGWQAAAGAGVFTETIKYDTFSEEATGSVWMLSGGYSWEHLQLQLRYFGFNSADYDDDLESADAVSLQLGWNL